MRIQWQNAYQHFLQKRLCNVYFYYKTSPKHKKLSKDECQEVFRNSSKFNDAFWRRWRRVNKSLCYWCLLSSGFPMIKISIIYSNCSALIFHLDFKYDNIFRSSQDGTAQNRKMAPSNGVFWRKCWWRSLFGGCPIIKISIIFSKSFYFNIFFRF